MPATSSPPRSRRRSSAFGLLLGAVLAVWGMSVVAPPAPAGAQDFTTTTAVGTTEPAPTVDAQTETTTVATDDNQTLVEAEPQEDRFLTSESRRIVAAIGGLVAVALLLLLLTIRYWRQTKPIPPEPEFEPVPAEDGVARTSRRAVAGADHAGVDESWEPLATDEHAIVDLPEVGPRPRPSVEARRKVLKRT